ncbi:hypothetical protein DC366_14045 [Pelagivirga sediminicola]|uniref:Uncharacterized protein n=1 Tax=Pelagivirga sediminicola TaxID=2170575 RepID=A0A2T7G520_9RHOB|nr:hypothetical protein [Pelagivirga sediminicola]PVA09500.1 hypothetical protein DC366_14045 [Pelagivirga sediminicola]
MMRNQNHAQAGQNIFMSSVVGLANTVAVIVTFFGAPELWRRTVGYVREVTYQMNGPAWVDIASIAWFGICIFLVFFISRASVGTALIFGGLAIVTRFM